MPFLGACGETVPTGVPFFTQPARIFSIASCSNRRRSLCANSMLLLTAICKAPATRSASLTRRGIPKRGDRRRQHASINGRRFRARPVIAGHVIAGHELSRADNSWARSVFGSVDGLLTAASVTFCKRGQILRNTRSPESTLDRARRAAPRIEQKIVRDGSPDCGRSTALSHR